MKAEQMKLNLEAQATWVVQGIVEVGAPGARLKDICLKVLEFNEHLGLGYASETLHNSVRRAIYEHLGDDDEGVFVRDGRGYYRLSVRVVVNAVVHADAWDFVRLLPDESLDCIVTDPPWTALDRHRAWGTTTRLTQRKWFRTRDPDKTFVEQLARVLKPGRHMYVFHPALNGDTVKVFRQVTGWMEEAGLNFEKALVWDKISMGMGYRFRYRHELVLFASKGKMRPLNNLGIPDVLQAKRVPSKEQVHDCQKPVELVKTLVLQSTDEGDLVADFFAGSGATGVACEETGRNYVLVDVELEWVEHMERKLAPSRVLELGGVCAVSA
jgi:site-specific DNA-methyltransferase (adenine-specific)